MDLNANGCCSGADSAFSAASPVQQDRCSSGPAALLCSSPVFPCGSPRGPPLAPAERRQPPLEVLGLAPESLYLIVIAMHQAFPSFSVALISQNCPRDAKCLFRAGSAFCLFSPLSPACLLMAHKQKSIRLFSRCKHKKLFT